MTKRLEEGTLEYDMDQFLTWYEMSTDYELGQAVRHTAEANLRRLLKKRVDYERPLAWQNLQRQLEGERAQVAALTREIDRRSNIGSERRQPKVGEPSELFVLSEALEESTAQCEDLQMKLHAALETAAKQGYELGVAHRNLAAHKGQNETLGREVERLRQEATTLAEALNESTAQRNEATDTVGALRAVVEMLRGNPNSKLVEQRCNEMRGGWSCALERGHEGNHSPGGLVEAGRAMARQARTKGQCTEHEDGKHVFDISTMHGIICACGKEYTSPGESAKSGVTFEGRAQPEECESSPCKRPRGHEGDHVSLAKGHKEEKLFSIVSQAGGDRSSYEEWGAVWRAGAEAGKAATEKPIDSSEKTELRRDRGTPAKPGELYEEAKATASSAVFKAYAAGLQHGSDDRDKVWAAHRATHSPCIGCDWLADGGEGKPEDVKPSEPPVHIARPPGMTVCGTGVEDLPDGHTWLWEIKGNPGATCASCIVLLRRKRR